MLLRDALVQFFNDGTLSIDKTEYHKIDFIGGRDSRGDRWSNMSIYRDEGKFLYSIIRQLRPARVLEIGVYDGCSSCHILQGLYDNKFGHLYSVDINSGVGGKVPLYLRPNWTLIIGDATTIDLPEFCDVVFEDSVHEAEGASKVFQNIDKSSPRLVIAHDALMHEIYPDGFAVRQAFESVFSPSRVVKLDDTQTGLIYSWRNSYAQNI